MQRFTIALAVLTVMLSAVASFAGAADQPIRFAIIGDRTGGHEEGIYPSILGEIERLRPEFIMTVGDMIEGYTEDTARLIAEWEEYSALIAGLSVPIHHTCGNHDITFPSMGSMFRRYLADPYYSFDHRGVHIIVFDNSPGGGGDPLPLADEQMNWLRSDLEANRDAACIIAFCHKPFFYTTVSDGHPEPIHDLFVEFGVDAVFTGHFHRYFNGEYDGIKYTCIGSSGGGIGERVLELGYHYAWVTVEGDQVYCNPIKMGSVQPSDFATTEEIHVISDYNHAGIVFESPAVAGPEQMVADATVRATLHNFSDDVACHDTVVWEVPDGWTVEPAEAPVAIPPGESTQLSFTVSGAGGLYPSPTLQVDFPLRDDLPCSISRGLWVGRQAAAQWAKTSITIDGDLNEAVWRRGETRLFGPDYSSDPVDPTEFYFAHDGGDNFYVAVRCSETVPDSVMAAVTERDGAVYGEDCVGFFFAPDPVGDTIYQVYINPLGTIFDQIIVWNESNWYNADRAFNGDYEVSARIGEDGWTVEARIPVSAFGRQNVNDGDWGLNFRRKQKRLETAGNWLSPIDYDPRTYGILSFVQ